MGKYNDVKAFSGYSGFWRTLAPGFGLLVIALVCLVQQGEVLAASREVSGKTILTSLGHASAEVPKGAKLQVLNTYGKLHSVDDIVGRRAILERNASPGERHATTGPTAVSRPQRRPWWVPGAAVSLSPPERAILAEVATRTPFNEVAPDPWEVPIREVKELGNHLGSSPAVAEWYVGGYADVAIPNGEGIGDRVTLDVISLLDGTLIDVDLDTSAVFGGKGDHFFEAVPGLGVELDFYHFRPDVDSQTVNFDGTILEIPIHMLMVDHTYPRGRLQPHIGVGGGISIANLEVTGTDDRDTVATFHALAGASFFLIPHLAIFTEYKFLQTSDFEFTFPQTDPVTGLTLKEDIEIDLTTHMIYAGIAWHF
jgi:opacity protein-like surface antigen